MKTSCHLNKKRVCDTFPRAPATCLARRALRSRGYRFGPRAVLGKRHEPHGGEFVVEVAALALSHCIAVVGSFVLRVAAHHSQHVCFAAPHAEGRERVQWPKGDRCALHARVVAHLGLHGLAPAREAKRLGELQSRKGHTNDRARGIGELGVRLGLVKLRVGAPPSVQPHAHMPRVALERAVWGCLQEAFEVRLAFPEREEYE
jgi:hypothetical protein